MFSRALVTLSILVLFLAGALRAQVAVAPLRIDRAQFLSSTGIPLSNGCVNFFATGTSTPQAIYADSGGINQLQNPLPLDAAGEASIWMTNTGYDIVANSGVVNTACSVSVGTQLWREINKNPFSIINGGSNYIVASSSSDPSGVAGMLAYRTDIPCFRGFTTIWDCFVTLTGSQSLTNKTLVNPVISSSTGAVLSSPNINGTVVTGPPATYLVMANDLVTGTTLNKLTKINPAGLAGFAILPLITDTGGITGVVTAGAGITGNATIQQNGSVSCVFDNATTSGNYIQISSSIAGDCHDAGVSYPSTGQVVGRSLATNAAIGTNIIDLFGPEIIAGLPRVVYSTVQTASSTSIGSVTMATAPASGATYRFTVYGDVTIIGTACTGTSTVNVFVSYQDPGEAGPGSSSFFILLPVGGNNGTVGRMILSADPGAFPLPYAGIFRAKGGTAVAFFTTYSAGATCAPPPTVQIYPMLEQMTIN